MIGEDGRGTPPRRNLVERNDDGTLTKETLKRAMKAFRKRKYKTVKSCQFSFFYWAGVISQLKTHNKIFEQLIATRLLKIQPNPSGVTATMHRSWMFKVNFILSIQR